MLSWHHGVMSDCDGVVAMMVRNESNEHGVYQVPHCGGSLELSEVTYFLWDSACHAVERQNKNLEVGPIANP